MGGGSLKETVLWTNSAPTSAFTGQNVNLSQDIDNFKYISIKYRASTSSTSTEISFMVSSADLKKSVSQENNIMLFFGARLSGTTFYSRMVRYNSDTQIEITNAYILNGSGSNNSASIPLQIIGLK